MCVEPINSNLKTEYIIIYIKNRLLNFKINIQWRTASLASTVTE